jgi:adenine-specific DNA methylase
MRTGEGGMSRESGIRMIEIENKRGGRESELRRRRRRRRLRRELRRESEERILKRREFS